LTKLFLGIEIGGTKLQIGIGTGDASPLAGLWRETVEPKLGAEQIRRQIVRGTNELIVRTGIAREQIPGAGIGFGGPVDAKSGITITSHQVPGWDSFPIVDWASRELALFATLHNDADTAALAEAQFGAGRGFDPVLYVTVGSGIGGGLIVGGNIFRGSGAGALEIGHLLPGKSPRHGACDDMSVEAIASGFGIEQRARRCIADREETLYAAAAPHARLLELAENDAEKITTQFIARAAAEGNTFCRELLADATEALGWALGQAITLINPARIVIGGGVSLIGEDLFFAPLRRTCHAATFHSFADVADIVPASLGEEVVVHGAIALAAMNDS